MTTSLREELDRLADTQTFSPDPSAWERGRRARRRSRAAAGVAALALVAGLGGLGALAVRPDGVGPADGVVPEGAIPSRITGPEGAVVTDLAIGRASVAYVDDTGVPVLVDATTGDAARVELPDFPSPEAFDLAADHRRGPWLALSPDGTRVAYPITARFEHEPGQFSLQTSWYRVVDLTTGESDLVDLPPYGSTPLALTWTADGELGVDAYDKGRVGKPLPDVVSWAIDPATSSATTKPLLGVTAPGGGISAPFPGPDTAPRRPDPVALAAPVDAVRFVTSTDTGLERPLPSDLYPDGARVTPIGWADNSLLVAEVDAPEGSYVEGEHLVLLTSPDRPETEWTYRILVREVPETESLSLAVDLVPDLDGTSSQQLTHDFEATAGTPWRERAPYLLGGVMALLAGLAFVRMLRHQA